MWARDTLRERPSSRYETSGFHEDECQREGYPRSTVELLDVLISPSVGAPT
jgi:hypothetical protein